MDCADDGTEDGEEANEDANEVDEIGSGADESGEVVLIRMMLVKLALRIKSAKSLIVYSSGFPRFTGCEKLPFINFIKPSTRSLTY
jgi:hypothetical protein